ncbi:MAG: hypothetical protein CMI96_00320 [Pelagibacteraceae bacterium]|nr:hypothetical protein [Pelagibacteraceae bacterium]|tara:strand:- start:34374 stop:36239 length:1866 start_codon:yes stop_codon:yes gene_type:complete
MITLVGFLCLILSSFVSFILITSEIIKKLTIKYFILLNKISTSLTLLSFFILMYSYIISDFSNFNVFQNSHTDKPLIYKISGTWGNHEGSMLLWISIMSLYSFFFLINKNINERFKRKSLTIQNTLFLFFCLFIIFTSNPFLKTTINVEQGLGLNPILQDPSLAFHPPILYAGYVGYSLIFSFAIAGLLEKKINVEWIILVRKWSLICWTFLTAGIALGSYWAYYELGWGGWWFWDPVENVSLMPWIAGLALVHSLFLAKGEYILQKWIIFLSILCFSLSIFGTFLVRSGILISVHSFSSDSSRGLFILLIFFLVTGFGFLIFLINQPKNEKPIQLLFINKTSALVINNILMIIAVATILLGTIYPIIVEVISNTRISVGGPYFNSTVIPIMLPGFLLMSIAPALSWQSNKVKKIKYYIIVFIVLSFLILVQSLFTSFNTWGFLGILLGTWIILASLLSVFLSFPFHLNYNYVKNINSLIAHIGVGIAIIGITSSSIFKSENNYFLSKGDEINYGNTIIKFENTTINNIKNYESLRLNFLIIKNNKIVSKIEAGKNYYPISKTVTTEVGIYHDWFRDIYIVVGNKDDNKWLVKIHNNPLVSLIWLGIIIMIFSGLIGITKK